MEMAKAPADASQASPMTADGRSVMLIALGRNGRLILDSWTRPKYAKLTGRKAADDVIQRRFRRYGQYAGLAFWMMLTQDWVE